MSGLKVMIDGEWVERKEIERAKWKFKKYKTSRR